MPAARSCCLNGGGECFSCFVRVKFRIEKIIKRQWAVCWQRRDGDAVVLKRTSGAVARDAPDLLKVKSLLEAGRKCKDRVPLESDDLVEPMVTRRCIGRDDDLQQMGDSLTKETGNCPDFITPHVLDLFC